MSATMLHFTGSLTPQAAAQPTKPWSAYFEINRTAGTLTGWISDEAPDPNTDPVPGATWAIDGLHLVETQVGYDVTGVIRDPDGVAWQISGTAQDRELTPETVTVAGGVYTDLVIPAGQVWELDPVQDCDVTLNGRTEVMGTLRSRPEADVAHTITMVCDESAYIGGEAGMGTDPGLHVMGAGVLDLAGTYRKRWTNLTNGEAAGSTVLAVTDSTGWDVGDELVVTPTVERSTGVWWDAYDERTIISVDASGVAVDGLAHPHPERFVGGFRHTAEVINLTSNMTVRSDAGTRGHIMFHNGTGPQTISNVRFDGLGTHGPNEDILGRYPLHFHLCGDGSRSSLISGCVITNSGLRGFVPHASHGITIDGCATHNTHGQAYWWDVPHITDNSTWSNNIASKTTWFDLPFRWWGLRAFELGAGTGNKCFGNVAVGLPGVDGPGSPGGGFSWPGGLHHLPSTWGFHDNLVHNCKGAALGVWQNDPETHDTTGPAHVYSCESGFDLGAYNVNYIIDGHAYCDIGTALHLHAKPFGAGGRLEVRNMAVEGTDDWLVRVHRHNAPDTSVTVLDGLSTSGDGIWVNSGHEGLHDTLLHVSGFTAGGQRYKFEDNVPAGSIVTDHDLGEELRPVTYTGDTSGATFDATWNCWRFPI